jgi:hypothetical protein
LNRTQEKTKTFLTRQDSWCFFPCLQWPREAKQWKQKKNTWRYFRKNYLKSIFNKLPQIFYTLTVLKSARDKLKEKKLCVI